MNVTTGSRITRRSMSRGIGISAAVALTGVLGVNNHPSVLANSAPSMQECSLGCTTSTCGQIPAGTTLFPQNNIWNTPIDTLPVDARSDAYIANMEPDSGMHPDFGSGLYEGLPLGIPFVQVPADQPMVEITFEVAEESDAGPYPIPLDAPIEGGSCGTGDRHVIVVQEGTSLLYELYDAFQNSDGSWDAYGGAIFDLTSNDLRTAEWTSADAAGLPILPGLVRYEEIEAGVIEHALRFTVALTQEAYVWPARHQAGASTDLDVVPMGQRFRLKADVEIGDFAPANQIILQALKT